VEFSLTVGWFSSDAAGRPCGTAPAAMVVGRNSLATLLTGEECLKQKRRLMVILLPFLGLGSFGLRESDCETFFMSDQPTPIKLDAIFSLVTNQLAFYSRRSLALYIGDKHAHDMNFLSSIHQN
jgi:hypothetical protein